MHDETTREKFVVYINELKPFVLASLALFIISTVSGYMYYSLDPSYALNSLEGMEELAAMLEGLSPIEIMLLIFVNNSVKMFFSILLGFLLGIIPFIFLVMNGFIIGIFAHYQTVENGALFVIAGLTPHGIIEIPMLIISSAVGMKIGFTALQALSSKPVSLKDELIKGIKFYLHWLFPLILLAAIIETFITPLVIYLLVGI
ncbi:MAG: stage II sporulation protein M [Methanolobus sp.]